MNDLPVTPSSPPLACCVCGATAADVWRIARDHILGGDARYRAVRCARCATVRLDPRPPSLARFYTAGTYARAEEEESATSELGRRLDTYNRRLAERADAAARGNPSQGGHSRRVLDVGCGDGRFLAAMARMGWDVEGVETDPAAAALARRRTGGPVHETDLETRAPSRDDFDLISLLHVLEHVPDPRATLGAARRLLRPGGTLLLALPNTACLEARLFGSAWYLLDLPRHLWGFTPRTLVRLVEEAGFAVRSLRYFPFLFAPHSVRYALRAGRRAGMAASASPTEGSRLQTRVFLTLLGLAERLGKTLPGEIMELTAVAPEQR